MPPKKIMKLQPPHITDQPIVALMRRIGLEPGQSFDIDQADPAAKQARETVPQDTQKLMQWKITTMARVVNNWSMNTDTMGIYGNYYLKRAIIAQQGLGANLPRTPFIRKISAMRPASRSTGRRTMFSTSIRTLCRRY